MDITLSKNELEQILTEVKKEYDEVVKAEKAVKMEKSALPMNKEETTEGSGEKSKPETPKAQDPVPEGSKDKEMVKAEGDDSAPPKDKEEAPVDSEPSDSEVPVDSAPPQEAAPEEVPADQPPQEQAPDGMVSDDSMGPDQLLELYSGLSPEHLAQHWMAASQALFQSMSAEQVEPMVEQPPMDQPPAPAPEGMPPMAKTEDTEEFKALKKNFDDLKNQNDSLEKKLEEVTDKLSKKLGMPVQNGVTSDNVINKSETVDVKVISKSEVVDLLKSKAKEPKLSESDKQKIVKYTMKPEVTQELKDFLGLK